VAPFAVLCISIPINALWAPSQALIERDLRYRAMAMLEVGSDVLLYGVGLGLALAGAGVWAPVAGWIAAQTWLLLGSARLARFRPRWTWSRAEARSMVRFGSGYAGGSWVLGHPVELVNPLVIGPVLGATAVGQVALALRLIDTLGFAQRATRRMSLVMFGRVQHEAGRLRRAVADASALELLALGLPLAGFGLVAERVVPLVFGEEWRGATAVYPALALAAFLAASFNTSAYALQVLRCNRPVVISSIVQLALVVGVAALLVERFGPESLGWARMVGGIGLVSIAVALRRRIRHDVTTTVIWCVAIGPSILAATPGTHVALRALAAACLLIPLLAAPTRRQAAALLDGLRNTTPAVSTDPAFAEQGAVA
jgi:PST family polysaccharide transporter